MTTLATERPDTAATPPQVGPRPGFRHALNMELVKLRTVRSTWWTATACRCSSISW